MFERFTERARQSIVLAQDEARALKHGYIGTEHILLGLLREGEGVAARVLTEHGVTDEPTRTEIVRICGEGPHDVSGQIPFTPRAKKVLELALREALSLGHEYVGTEHILLGLARENDGVASRLLSDKGFGADAVRTAVVQKISPSAYEQAHRSLRRKVEVEILGDAELSFTSKSPLVQRVVVALERIAAALENGKAAA